VEKDEKRGQLTAALVHPRHGGIQSLATICAKSNKKNTIEPL
jgi:hypothetical protein